jgi:histidinol-phosphate/aromatic aminotransferase/cobyric acid decarboxylase-like protein
MAQTLSSPAADLAEHRLRRSETDHLDLATGVNRHGPPEAAFDALRSMTAADLALPARHAAARLEAAYAQAIGVDAGELVAGSAPSAFLATLPRHAVALPLPAWGDVLDLFGGRGFSRYPGEQLPSVEQVDAALDAAEVVVISNPQMPTGLVLDRDALAEAARRHAASTLVVDESAIDFIPDPTAATLVGTDADNVVVLRSAPAFYGIGATRTGVAWSRDPLVRSLLTARGALPLSGLDVAVTEAALDAGDWTAATRARLAADGAWLAAVVPVLGGRPVPTPLPYRFILTDTAAAQAATLAGAGISVRAFGPGHGVYPGAIGLFAPLEAERTQLAAALGAAHAAPALSEAG